MNTRNKATPSSFITQPITAATAQTTPTTTGAFTPTAASTPAAAAASSWPATATNTATSTAKTTGAATASVPPAAGDPGRRGRGLSDPRLALFSASGLPLRRLLYLFLLRLLLLLLPLLAACASPPPASPTGGYGGNPAVQATLGARQAQDAAATYTAAQQATQTARQATLSARDRATAAAYAQATGTAAAATEIAQATERAATGTASAATATAEDLSVQGTQIALVAVQTQNAIVAAATGTRQAANASAEMTAQAIHMANAQMLQEAERARLAAQQRRQAVVTSALPYLLTATGLALVVLTGLFAYLMVRGRNPIYHVEHMGHKIAVIPTANGSYTPLPAPASRSPLALPAPDGEADLGAMPAVPRRSPRASWRMFSAHTDPATVPLGVNETTGQPVFLDRRQTPHLLIAGTTGAGKTASGLVPYVAGSWGQQAHVVVVNARGSDFAACRGQTNLTLWPALRPLALIDPLADFLTRLVAEMDRRDAVLARYRVANWADLPTHAGQPGELLVAIDEFLTLVNAAQEAAELARLTQDSDKARALAYQVTVLWLRLRSLVNEGRKYGLFLAVTMTDPTRDAVGSHGMSLRRQMAMVGFRMNSAAASRSFLDVSGSDGLPSGSVGLSNGRFVYNIGGQVGTAIGFYPDRADLRRFFAARPVAPNPLPDDLAEAVAALDARRPAAGPGQPASPAPPYRPRPLEAGSRGASAQAARDGQALRPYLSGLETLNAAGSMLSDVSGRPSGQFLQNRLKPALKWLCDTEGNADAARLLDRFSE